MSSAKRVKGALLCQPGKNEQDIALTLTLENGETLTFWMSKEVAENLERIRPPIQRQSD